MSIPYTMIPIMEKHNMSIYYIQLMASMIPLKKFYDNEDNFDPIGFINAYKTLVNEKQGEKKEE